MKILTIFILMTAGIIGAEPLQTDFIAATNCAAFGITQFSVWTAATNAPDVKMWQGRCLIGSTNILWDSASSPTPCLIFVSEDFGSNAIPVAYSLPEVFDSTTLIPNAPVIGSTHGQ